LTGITAETWDDAVEAEGEPDPSEAGSPETLTVEGLLPDTTYAFAIKTADEIPNWSDLSNVVTAVTQTAPDITAPAAVTNLSAVSTTNSTVSFAWSASGDDGSTGTAAQYDLRYSLSQITDANWTSATQAGGEPAPGNPGAVETFAVSGLEDSTTYYFALKVADEVPNWSNLSNVVEVTTRDELDTTLPGTVSDLNVESVNSTSVTLGWTAPGDDGDQGTATSYDLRYSTSVITKGDWASATQIPNEPAPSASGTPESFTVTDLDPNTTYCFALKAIDDKGNESAVSNSPCGDTNTPPVASFTADPRSGTLETVFQFDASATSDAEDATGSLVFHWDWEGDGTYDYSVTGDPTATHQFASVGLRPVVLKVVDTRGLLDTDTVVIQVTETPDTDPPADVADLAVGTVSSASVELLWTAPGDDGTVGTASSYDVRYSLTEITDGNWDAATPVSGEPAPGAAGTQESFVVSGLSPNTTYYFALKTLDDAANPSGVSNSVSGVTNTAPVADFTVTPDSGTTATVFQFNASGSSDGEDALADLEFHWDWDGNGVSDYSTTGDPTASHQFTSAGTPLVILKVVDSLGLSDEASTSIGVTDGISPETIDDLTVGTITVSSVQLTWTAPGDDGSEGTATSYDLRYDTAAISEGTWDTALIAGGLSSPQIAGTQESFTVTGLDEATQYYFALKASDESSNESGLSNVVSATTLLDLPDLVLVPHGSFLMGDGEAYCGEDERVVSLTRDFELGRYEITNEEFITWVQWAYDQGYVTATSSSVQDNLDGSSEELVDLDDPNCEIQFSSGTFSLRNAGYGENPDHPVKEVTWFGAAAFCDWISLREGITRAYDHSTWECNGGDPYSADGYRLPTDAEWEWAAQYDDERRYPWGNTSPDCSRANYGGCTGWTVAVGSYAGAPSIEGEFLYDMAGNVWEWCNDWHVCDLGTTTVTDPVGPSSGLRRVLRGGSWEFFTYYPRCAYRSDSYPHLSHAYIGIRVARTAASKFRR
jgi:formylglycine-generating enzyme required for sulfatase activity